MSQAPVTKEVNLEIEVKLACDDLDRLRKAGLLLRLDTPRHFEDNWLLDLPDQSLFNQGAALRVRSVNGTGTVTYKGVVKETHESRLKVREEIESAVDEPERLRAARAPRHRPSPASRRPAHPARQTAGGRAS